MRKLMGKVYVDVVPAKFGNLTPGGSGGGSTPGTGNPRGRPKLDKPAERETQSVRLGEELRQAIKALAAEHERTFNGEIVYALKQYVRACKAQENPD